jgi:hypothetical protein
MKCKTLQAINLYLPLKEVAKRFSGEIVLAYLTNSRNLKKGFLAVNENFSKALL